MRFFLLLCILVTGFSFSLKSQFLTGKITDVSNGNPLPDVAVTILQVRKGTLTGTDGLYSLTIRSGRSKVEARHIGYQTEVREVQVKGNDTVTVDFQLRPKIYEQEQVVITANKVEREKAAVPVNITVIPEEKITNSVESNILPIISAEVPGLFITERGVAGFGLAAGSAGKISIRGVGGTDASFPVLMLIDGQPQFMGLMGHPLPDTYVSGDIEKVEVIKGPASVLYGTNAMGGAINLITRKPGAEGVSLTGKMTGGSFGTLKLHGSAGYCKKGSGGMVSYQHDQTDGHRPSSLFRLDNGNFKLFGSFNSRFSGDLTLNRSLFRASDPGSIYDPAAGFAHNSHWVNIARTNCFLSLSNHFSFSEGGIKAYFLWGNHNMYDGWKSKDENRGISLFQVFRIPGDGLVHIGFDMKKYGGKGISPGLGNVSGQYLSSEETGVYMMVDRTFFSKLSLSAGIRLDHHSGFGDTWIPQFGAAYPVSGKTHAKLGISRGFRNPSIRELYLFPTANPDLKPESMWNHELSLSRGFAGGKGTFEITGFILNGENLILAVPNPAAPPPVKNANSGEFNHKGLETTIRYSVNDHLSFRGSHSYLHMDRPKVSSPVHQFFAEGEYRREKASLSVSVRHIAKLYTLTSPQNITQTYTLLNSRFAYQLNKHTLFFISGENLLDENYQMQYGYPMPGIMFFGGLSLSL